MALSNPRFPGVQAFLELSEFGRDQARDERFIAAVRSEFGNVQNRQLLGQEAPLQAPHLVLASQSAQLSLSAVQAAVQLQFYGDLITDIEKALAYGERKILSVFEALKDVGVGVSSIGLIARFTFPHQEEDPESAPVHVMRALTKVDVEPADLEDAQVRVAFKVRDTYFLHLTLANYEVRQYEQAVGPGLNSVKIQPWLGVVDETGIELTVDINNKLEARVKESETKVTSDGVTAAIGLLRHVALTSGPKFAETGEVSLAELIDSSVIEAHDA